MADTFHSAFAWPTPEHVDFLTTRTPFTRPQKPRSHYSTSETASAVTPPVHTFVVSERRLWLPSPWLTAQQRSAVITFRPLSVTIFSSARRQSFCAVGRRDFSDWSRRLLQSLLSTCCFPSLRGASQSFSVWVRALLVQARSESFSCVEVSRFDRSWVFLSCWTGLRFFGWSLRVAHSDESF